MRFLLFFVIAIVACKNTQKPNATAPSSVKADTTAPAVNNYGWDAARVSGSNDDTSRPRQAHIAPRPVKVPIENMPRPSSSRRGYMTDGFWSFQMAFVGNDSLVHTEYVPKWLEFKDDLTFQIYIKNKVVGSGNWNWDETNSEIYIACPADPWLNNTWKVQEKGFVMVWLGNTSINLTGIQCRVIKNKTLPQQ
jgi:hypothetical protein